MPKSRSVRKSSKKAARPAVTLQDVASGNFLTEEHEVFFARIEAEAGKLMAEAEPDEWPLTACLLESDGDAELRRLFATYEEDGDPGWLFARALEAFRRTGDDEEGRRRLREAREVNAHAAAYLLGERMMPERLPDMYLEGSKEEAMALVDMYGDGWRRTPGALDWLRRQVAAKP